jgi:hypothetical protein
MGMNTISAGRQSTPAPVSRTEFVNPGDAVRLDELMRAQEKAERRKKQPREGYEKYRVIL